MKTLSLILALAMATPALAALPKPPGDPAPAKPADTPASVTYEVVGCHWINNQWEHPEDFHFKTANLKKARDYVLEINTYAGWQAATNFDPALVPAVNMTDPVLPKKTAPLPTPPKAAFTVWAYKLVDGKWIKQDAYCGSSASWSECQKYIADVSAVPGWCVTTNCPASLPAFRQDLAITGAKTRGVTWYAPQYNYYDDGGSSSDTYVNRRGRRVAYPDMTELHY